MNASRASHESEHHDASLRARPLADAARERGHEDVHPAYARRPAHSGARRRPTCACRAASASCWSGRRAPARARCCAACTATTSRRRVRSCCATSGRPGRCLSITGAAPHDIMRMRRDVIGYVSQFLRVIPRVSTLDLVAEPLIARGVEAGEHGRRASDLLARLNIPARLWPLAPADVLGRRATTREYRARNDRGTSGPVARRTDRLARCAEPRCRRPASSSRRANAARRSSGSSTTRPRAKPSRRGSSNSPRSRHRSPPEGPGPRERTARRPTQHTGIQAHSTEDWSVPTRNRTDHGVAGC